MMMNKLINYILFSALILIGACSKETFNYSQAPIKPDKIKVLVFNTSHYVLNADGISTLSYHLLPSYYPYEGQETTASIPLSWFNRSDYNFYYDEPDGTKVSVDRDYLRFEAGTPAKTIQVYAEVFGKQTRKIPVQIRSVWGTNVKEKVIPVVFHVLQYTGTTNTEFVIESIHLTEKIKKLNKAFSRKISTGAASTDTKIRFELASHTVQGQAMVSPGMNKVKFGAKELNKTDFSQFYNSGGNFLWSEFFQYYGVGWDAKEVLNIWVLPTGKEVIPSFSPAIIKEGIEPLKGLSMVPVSDTYVPSLAESGIIINYSTFQSLELNSVIGKYLGLLPTSNINGVKDNDSDYCDDTFLYASKENSEDTKNGINRPIKFVSDNIMDVKTQNISVTNEQAARMHYVLENVPSRKMWK